MPIVDLRKSLIASMPRVVVESPYSGDVQLNLRYLRACLRDCFERGELPFASHALYTQPGVLNDEDPQERELGIQAGFAWAALAEKRVIYQDLGVSSGMVEGMNHAREIKQPVEFRVLPYAKLSEVLSDS